MKNLYNILDINNDATLSQIKKAYRVKAKLYHPDSNISKQVDGEKFIEIKEAYDILKNQNLRSNYDLELSKFNEKLNQKKNHKMEFDFDNNKDNINDINRRKQDYNKRDEEFFNENGFNNGYKTRKETYKNDYTNVSNWIYLYTLLIILSIWNLFYRPYYEVGELWWIWIFVGVFSIYQANRIMGKSKR